MAAIAERIPVIDADTHVVEAEDLWTSRVSVKKWGELVPHTQWDEEKKEDAWYFGDERFAAVAGPAMAGWKEYPPSHPPRLADADPACWDPRTRLERMDQYGIHAQILYPNVGGFGSNRFLRLKEPELMLQCVQAYNDFLSDWCSADMKRLVPIMALPFWDLDQTVKEIDRAAKNGHKGILFSGEPHAFGFQHLCDPHWDPIWAAAQDHQLTINFHVASGDMDKITRSLYPGNGPHVNFAQMGALFYMDCVHAVTDVIVSGICHRFPKLNFVSVESGVGWVPFALEAVDWQWMNGGAFLEHPERMLPSEYFKRQVYACFWFEHKTAKAAIDIVGADNFLYETDFPHPTSMSPGPASSAVMPSQFLDTHFSDLPEDVLRKILHDNAARLYHLD